MASTSARFVSLLLIASCLWAVGCARQQHRPAYTCPAIHGPVTIDGVLSEDAWRASEVVREFGVPVSHRIPVHATVGRVMWDARCLYVAFDATDPDLRAVFTERDSDTYRDDVLEIFFKTGPEDETHYNFEINPFGTLKDEIHTPAKRFQTDWNCEGIRIATKTVGTLNDPTDRDERWTLEVAIPFAALPTLEGRKPRAGDVWLFELARIDRSANLPDGKELTSTAPLRKKWFHDSTDWPRLIFQRNPAKGTHFPPRRSLSPTPRPGQTAIGGAGVQAGR